MIKNHFKTAFRSFSRHAIFSFINVLGLTIGMTACFLIFLYVGFETSYDSFNKKADRIYRLVCDTKTSTGTVSNSYTSPPMGFNIKNDFPEVESIVRLEWLGAAVSNGRMVFQEEGMWLAESSLFSVFDFQLLKGNPRTALKEPGSIVLSETAAKKYFGSSDPVGKHLTVQNGRFSATVTGVMRDIPENSQIKADIFISQTTLSTLYNFDSDWKAFGQHTYLLLKPGTDATALQAKLPLFLQRYIGQQMKQSNQYYSLFLEPLKWVNLYSRYGVNTKNDQIESRSISNVYIFSAVALFILLIAGINFINLSTARATDRAKEVGIRKVAGATRVQLIGQFMAEALLIALMAFILAVLLSALLLPIFNHLSGRTVGRDIFEHPDSIIILFSLSIGFGIAAGIYPALVLSSYKPVLVLKGRFVSGSRGILLRKCLVITQFTVSIILIVGIIVIYTQMHFMQSQDLGFSKEQMMVINTRGNLNGSLKNQHLKMLKQEIENIPGVRSAAWSGGIPGGDNPLADTKIENKSGDMQVAQLQYYPVDADFIKQYHIQMVAGREFSKDLATDSTQAIILNETAVKMFGYSSPQQAIGKRFSQWNRQGKIIGIAKDFHFRSLKETIQPLTMRMGPEDYYILSVNVTTSHLSVTVDAILRKWKKLFPQLPFDHFFADEYFDRQYRAENRFGSLFLNFAILAVFIACLGLFGLVSYSTIHRTREIGIRKVLGASVFGVVNLLSVDFLKLVFISFLIASPLAWLIMNKWLGGFAYRVNISWWIFAIAAALALIIAMLTISLQTIKAAIANPVKSLRTE